MCTTARKTTLWTQSDAKTSNPTAVSHLFGQSVSQAPTCSICTRLQVISGRTAHMLPIPHCNTQRTCLYRQALLQLSIHLLSCTWNNKDERTNSLYWAVAVVLMVSSCSNNIDLCQHTELLLTVHRHPSTGVYYVNRQQFSRNWIWSSRTKQNHFMGTYVVSTFLSIITQKKHINYLFLL
jgi:hypothetical protein